MFRILIPILLLALPATAQNFPQNREGVWHGVGVQIDGYDWAITVTIRPEQTSIDYPTLDCGGRWDYLKVTDDQIVAVERILYGIENCLDGGLVKVADNDGVSLIYNWFDSAGNLAAAAVLIEGTLEMDEYKPLLDLTMDSVGQDFIQDNARIILEENEL